MIINSVKISYPGLGSPTVYYSNQNFAFSGGIVTVPCGNVLAPNQSMPGPVMVGKVRLKTETNAGAIVYIAGITGNDGRGNQVMLYSGDTPPTTAMNVELMKQFGPSDLPLSNINVNIAVSGGVPILSLEVAAGP